MLENLFDLVKQHAGSAIIDNPAIPNQHNDEAIQTASSSIVDGLKNAVSGGNIADIMQLFQGGAGNAANNPLAQNIQSGFVQNLIGKFGLDTQAAGNIAQNLIPNVLQKFVHKTNDPNDSSFDLQGILSNIGGGQLDVNSLIGKFTNNSGGGIMDSIKGLFGN